MSNSVSSTSSLSQLQQVFPDVIQVDTRALASVLGISVKTINNAGDDFHIRAVRFGRRKYFRLVDIACFMDSSLGIVSDSTSVSIFAPGPVVSLGIKPAVESKSPILKRKRGRPSHAERGHLPALAKKGRVA